MKHIVKFLLIILIVGCILGVASALPTSYNPWTGKLDYFGLRDFNCSVGDYVTGVMDNGTFRCATVSTGNPFDQSLNTTDNVTFDKLTMGEFNSTFANGFIRSYLYKNFFNLAGFDIPMLSGAFDTPYGNYNSFGVENGLWVVGNDHAGVPELGGKPNLNLIMVDNKTNHVFIESFNGSDGNVDFWSSVGGNFTFNGEIYSEGNQVCTGENGLCNQTEFDESNYYNKTEVDTNISTAIISLSNTTIAREGTDTQLCTGNEVAQNITIITNSSGVFITDWACVEISSGLWTNVSGTATYDGPANSTRMDAINYSFNTEYPKIYKENGGIVFAIA